MFPPIEIANPAKNIPLFSLETLQRNDARPSNFGRKISGFGQIFFFFTMKSA